MLGGSVDDGQPSDCRPAGACVIAVIDDGDPDGGIVATAPLPFVDGSPLAPAPTVTVSPAEGLDDLQEVAVAGSGFVWSDRAIVVQCAAGAAGTAPFFLYEDCDSDTTLDVAVADGALAVDYPASALIATERHGRVDCRQAGACEVVVTQGHGVVAGKLGRAAVTFDPSTVVVTPTMTVDPASGLADGDQVTLSASGLRPGSFVDTNLCVGDPAGGRCVWLDAWGEVDAAGEVTVQAAGVGHVHGVERRVGGGGRLPHQRRAVHDRPVAGQRGLGPARPPPPWPSTPRHPSCPARRSSSSRPPACPTTPRSRSRAATSRPTASSTSTCAPATTGPAATRTPGPTPRSTPTGTFTVDMAISSVLSPWEGEPIDCRQESCEVVARDQARSREASASLAFAPEAPPVHRYLDPVFDAVAVTRDVVFRDVTDAAGNPVQLTADVYEPVGDTAAKRPAVVWMTGGWFDEALDMAAYADAFARRGYVAVTMEYRSRPGFSCCPTRDALGVTAALVDAHDDATHGVMWLREHAADYRIDPDAIAAGGAQAGAVAAYGLAFRPGESHHHGPAEVAAALPIGGMSLGEPGDEGAPVLAFHGADDLLAPAHLSDWACTDAHHMDVTCEVVEYPNTSGELAVTRQRDIVRRSSEFLAANVLEPLGYEVAPVDPPAEPPAEPPADPTDPTDRPPTPPTRRAAAAARPGRAPPPAPASRATRARARPRGACPAPAPTRCRCCRWASCWPPRAPPWSPRRAGAGGGAWPSSPPGALGAPRGRGGRRATRAAPGCRRWPSWPSSGWSWG